MEYTSNLNMLWASLLLEEAARLGIQYALIAPGSRSTPLAVAAWRNPALKKVVHFDERGAAFFALGAARAGQPAAVICTSGTALANCFPAVAEANLSALPLLILSADRPPELQRCGANQTMDQKELFGSHVHVSLSLPCPDAAVSPGELLSSVDQALHHCFKEAPGPVHINCPFREPLAPVIVEAPWPEGYLDELQDWKGAARPWSAAEVPGSTIDHSMLYDLLDEFQGYEKKALLLGAMHDPEDQEMARLLAKALQWPVFPDLLSGCRKAPLPTHFLPYYDLALKAAGAAGLPDAFDAVLHLGDIFLSKGFNEFLADRKPQRYVQVHARPDKRDPYHLTTQHLQIKVAPFCQAWYEKLREGEGKHAHPAPEVQSAFSNVECFDESLSGDGPLSEFSLAALLSRKMDPCRALFIGNSMPVRYMDMQHEPCNAFLIHANRGVSGIDGNIATAAGMAAAGKRPVVALVGDMTALHDLSSFALLSRSPVPVILIIVNNGGGGIFEHLPIASFPEVLDSCFIHPHDWEFQGLARMFDLRHCEVRTVEDFEAAWDSVKDAEKSCIIECRIDRQHSLASYREVIASLKKRIAAQLSSDSDS
jgi:2-succinyl-5-enolpyruvyl-6-hydroxy-3-cyclohexene-1-carboxylate synthase